MEEHTYSSMGTLQGNTYYYSLAGQLIGELTGQSATKTNIFLSADKTQGNQQRMNPYEYVGGNPETKNDPTGQFVPTPGGGAY